MTRDYPLTQVQREYQRLRADNPHLTDRELWRQAEQLTRGKLIKSAGGKGRGVQKRSDIGIAGFILVSVATPMAVASLLLLFSPDSRSEDWIFFMWVGASLLGAVGLGFLRAAHRRIRRSLGLVTGGNLVNAGIALAVLGATASFFYFFLAGLMASGS